MNINLKRRMDDMGWTQARLIEELSARGVKVSRKSVSAWINGRCKPRAKAARALYDATGVDMRPPPLEVYRVTGKGRPWHRIRTIDGRELAASKTERPQDMISRLMTEGVIARHACIALSSRATDVERALTVARSRKR